MNKKFCHTSLLLCELTALELIVKLGEGRAFKFIYCNLCISPPGGLSFSNHFLKGFNRKGGFIGEGTGEGETFQSIHFISHNSITNVAYSFSSLSCFQNYLYVL